MTRLHPIVPCAATLLLSLGACTPADRPEEEETMEAAPGTLTLLDAGFATPESVLHDDRADRYLVSNINGEPLGKDSNGFISRVTPNGDVEALRWIDGAREGVTLHAPKGLALKGDTLFVADIDSVRAFHRTSGEPLGARGVPGADFLNGLAVGPDGTLYVSDTGMDATFSPTGSDAVYRFEDEGPRAIAEGAGLMNPNGLVVDGEAVLMVPFGGNVVFRIPSDGGEAEPLVTLPAGQLDGIVRTADGELLVSSWEAGAVYRVSTDGSVSIHAEGIEAPADIGWDAGRQRLLVPLFMGDAVQFHTGG